MKKISIIGKSTVDSNSQEFKMIHSLAKKLVENGRGVIHGGYAGGIMEAVSNGAHEAIQENNLSKEFNLGIHEERFDKDWPRVEGAHFSDPSKDIFDRLRLVTAGDVVVVAPIGGDGTALEVDIVIHENLLTKYSGEKIKPVIFLETENGTKWKEFISSRNLLATSEKILEKDWIYFVKNIDDIITIINNHTQ